MNNSLNEYLRFNLELNIELNHFLARFNVKMNNQNVSATPNLAARLVYLVARVYLAARLVCLVARFYLTARFWPPEMKFQENTAKLLFQRPQPTGDKLSDQVLKQHFYFYIYEHFTMMTLRAMVASGIKLIFTIVKYTNTTYENTQIHKYNI